MLIEGILHAVWVIITTRAFTNRDFLSFIVNSQYATAAKLSTLNPTLEHAMDSQYARFSLRLGGWINDPEGGVI